MTARPRIYVEKTRWWLNENGFPPGPVVTAPRLRDLIRVRATAAFFRPMLHSVRASSRAAQPGSGIVMPKLNPVPTNEPPPETAPRHVSSPAAAKPGAKTAGTFLTERYSAS